MKKTSLFVFVSVSLLVFLSVSFGLLSQDNSLTDEQKVMKIAVDYIEKNYGIDYSINGDVEIVHYGESGSEAGDYTYPTASFRIPADYQQSGQLVYVMVDPDTEEIMKVFTHPSKSMLPSTPP